MPSLSAVKNFLSANFISNANTGQAAVPAFGSKGFLPGHVWIDKVTGVRYTNVGTSTYSMHVADGVNRQTLRENFLLRPGINADSDVPAGNTYNTVQMQLGIDKNRNFELLGANMTSALCTFAAGGGITMTTAGAATDAAILLPHLNTGATAWTSNLWNTDREISFETTLVTDALIADETIWAGFKLTNTPTTATDADQTFFRYAAATNSGKWQCIDYNTTVANAMDSGVAVAVSTTYALRIQVDGNRVPRYYINNVLVATGLALKANTALIPYIGILSATSATAKALIVRSIACGESYV